MQLWQVIRLQIFTRKVIITKCIMILQDDRFKTIHILGHRFKETIKQVIFQKFVFFRQRRCLQEFQNGARMFQIKMRI